MRKNISALALAAAFAATTFTAQAAPVFSFIHLHPHANAHEDARVHFKLVNKGTSFCDVKIRGHVYRMLPGQLLDIQAPAGTIVYADANIPLHRSGDVLVKISPALNHTVVQIGKVG